MKRRSKAGGELAKARLRKVPKPKRRNAPKAVARSHSPSIQEETEVARLSRELSEAREQQTAASDVLQLISSLAGELEPVFQAILANATRICEAKFGNLLIYENGAFRNVATHNVPNAFADYVRREPVFSPGPRNALRRLAATKQVVHVFDYTDVPDSPAVRFGRARSLIAVPMLKESELIGAIAIYRQEVRPFTDKQIALVTSFARQAVIAIETARLLNELRQRTTDLTERTADLTEALEQQTATSEVLQVISRSPSDLEPVFATMLEKAVRICDATFGNIFRWDGEAFQLMAAHKTPPAFAKKRKLSPIRPTPTTLFGRLVATKSMVHTPDLAAEKQYVEERRPSYVEAVELGGIRAFLVVPMLKNDELIGAIGLFRHEVRPFTDRQIELVKGFAAQAVIAIENARLLNELRQSLEEQTATSDVLRVISGFPGELEPVFAAMLGSATRICEAEFGNLFLREEDSFRAVAWHGEPTYVNTWRGPALTIKTDIVDIPLARLAMTKQRVHVADLTQEAAYKAGHEHLVALINKGGARTLLIVPMVRERTLVGAIAIYRQEVRPFSDKQIALMENFAAQAVIAIENARLLNELRQRTADLTESLEQQTATSEVLGVISRSKFELQPILQSVVDTAARLCRAEAAGIFRLESGLYRFAAGYSLDPAYVEIEQQTPISPGPGTVVGRAALSWKVARIDDAWSDPLYERKEDAKIGAVRSMIGVPLLREDEPIGAIALARNRVEPFTDREIELVTTFALKFGMFGLAGPNSTALNGSLTLASGPFTLTRQGSISETTTGFGDLYPQAIIRWNNGVHNWMVYGTGDIPVGDYNPANLANIGIGHGAVDGGGGYTYLDPTLGHEFSAVTGFTYNLINPSTNYQNGIDWHLDWGASQFLTKQIFVGAVGYFYEQVSPDRGCAPQLCPFESGVIGVGPQVGFIFPVGQLQAYLNFKAYGEFDAHDRPSGWNAWVTLSFSPPAPTNPKSAMLTKQ